jgi:hypothetical protein
MPIYSEDRAVDEIKRLSGEAKLHLAHIVRNGLCSVLASYRLGLDVEETILEFESEWSGLGL